LEIYGQENIPQSGGALLAANHRNFKDIFFLPAAVERRHVTMVSKHELLRVPALGWYLRSLGAIPVHREGPTKSEMEAMLQKLKEGRIVASFPEGTRSKKRRKELHEADMEEFKPGTAWLARRAGALTIPVAIYAMDGPVRGWHGIAFGMPAEPPAHKKDEEQWTLDLHADIKKLYEFLHQQRTKSLLKSN